ncbi:MAG TPA: type 4a pilus biogenesis protein PilO [Thermoanaerobaculia bacterium]|jgi:Tfp pilus assembly protein PilO|nr:type 4a pilus biogenesis protein PilO [Thermoanaerobaculia bacterium]
MKNPGEIWRQRIWVWLPAVLFFLLNAGAFSVYKLGYAGQVQSLDSDLDRRRDELSKLAEEGKQQEARLAQIRTNEQEEAQLYEIFSTRSRRLIAVTGEFKDLARKAGLEPQTISYTEDEIEDYGLIKRSWSFSVEGTYLELRRFISLLEKSPSFVTLEEVTLAEGSDQESPELRMNLALSTLFTEEIGDRPLAAPISTGTATSPTSTAPAAGRVP